MIKLIKVNGTYYAASVSDLNKLRKTGLQGNLGYLNLHLLTMHVKAFGFSVELQGIQ